MDLFSVHQFFADETSEEVASQLDAKSAVETAHSFTTRPAAVMGIIRRVIITDSSDCCVFEWQSGQGVTFPTREMLREARP